MAEIVSQYRIEVNGAVTNLNKLADTTTNAAKKGDELGKSTDKAGQQATNASGKFANLGKQILAAFGLVGVVTTFVSAIKNAVNITKNFEEQMSKVRAISGATDAEMVRLERSAKKLGSTTEYTATQVGQLQEEYARLGFTTKEILAATEATLNLATATGSSLAEAAEVAGSTVRAFGLDASETVRVTDVMAASFSKSALNMERFRESMKMVAPVARAANIPLETTTALLGQLANAGVTGSLAGTALKNLLSKLSDENSSLSKQLGFSVKNTDDLFRAFKQLQGQTLSLTEATELTDERSKAAFITLVGGIETVKDLNRAMDDAAGTTKRMADIMRDNLAKDVDALTSAWEGLVLQISNTSALRGATQFLTQWLVTTKMIVSSQADLFAEAVDAQIESAERYAASAINKISAIEDEIEVSKLLTNEIDFHSKKLDEATDAYKAFTPFVRKNGSMMDGQAEKQASLNQQVVWHKTILEALSEEMAKHIGTKEDDVKATKDQIRNIFFLTNAIKLLKEEAEKEGTSRERIREILKQIIPLETELAELLGKETDAMKALREETEKATKAEEDRLTALDKASDEKLKKRLAVDAFIAERTALGLKGEMEAAKFKEERNLERMEIDALAVGASAEKIEAIRQASVDEQMRIQNEYGTKVQEIEDAGVKAVQDAEDEKQKIRDKAINDFRDEFQQFADLSTQAIGLISQAQQAATDSELVMLEASLNAGQITREEYDQKRKELLKRQAEENKALALAQATINGAMAAINAYAEGGPIAAAIAAIFAAAQVAIIAATPIPQFEKGGEVRGRRHAQGGTIIEAEAGEYVVNRSAASKNAALIEAINKGVADAYIMRNWVAPAVDAALLNGWQDMGKSADLNGLTANLKDHNIIRAMDRNREATTYGLAVIAEKMGNRKTNRGGYA